MANIKKAVQNLSNSGWDGIGAEDKALLKTHYSKSDLQALSNDGWDGLSDSTKNIFRAKYATPSAPTAPAPMSDEELLRRVRITNKGPLDVARDLWAGTRNTMADMASYPEAVYMSMTGKEGNLNNFTRAKFDANRQKAYEMGKAGQGVPVLVADPLNLVGGLLAKGVLRVGAEIGKDIAKYTPFLTKSGAVNSIARAVPVGATLGGVSGAMEPGGSAGHGALVGGLSAGLLGGLGHGLSYAGEQLYPHRQFLLTETRAKYGKASEEAMKAAMREQMDRVGTFGWQNRYIDVADANRALIGQEYDAALDAIPHMRPITPDMPETMRYSTNYAFPRAIDPNDYAADVAARAEALRIADLRGPVSKTVSSSGLKKALEKRAADFEDDLLAQGPYAARYQSGKPVSDELQQRIADMGFIDIRDVSKLRNKFSSQYGRGVTRKETVQQAADELMHDALVGKIKAENPEYTQYLADRNTDQRYAIAGRLAKQALVDTKVPTGLLRFGPLPALNNYAAPSLMYGGGKLLRTPFALQAGQRLADRLYAPAVDTTR